MLGTGHFILETHLRSMYVLEAGAALGDIPKAVAYAGRDSQLWRFEGNIMVDRRGLVLEYTGATGMGNFIMAEKSGAASQKFNIDGFMFQSMVNTWAIDIPGCVPSPDCGVYLHPQHGGTNQLWNVVTVLLSKDGKNNSTTRLLFTNICLECDFPFIHDGVYVHYCVIEPKDDYWCPTAFDVEKNSLVRKFKDGVRETPLILTC